MDDKKYTMTVRVEGLTGGQAIALRRVLEEMERSAGGKGEWISFYADGCRFEPRIVTKIEGGFNEVDRHIPEILHLMDNDCRFRMTTNGDGTFIDPDLYDQYYDHPETVDILKFLDTHRDDPAVADILNS